MVSGVGEASAKSDSPGSPPSVAAVTVKLFGSSQSLVPGHSLPCRVPCG